MADLTPALLTGPALAARLWHAGLRVDAIARMMAPTPEATVRDWLASEGIAPQAERANGRPSLQARAAAVWDLPPAFPGWENEAAAVGWNIADLLSFAEERGINAYAEAAKLIARQEQEQAQAETAPAACVGDIWPLRFEAPEGEATP